MIEKVEIYFDYFYLKAPKLQTSESRGISLKNLFEKEHIPLKEDEFIDQKFINFLQANPKELEFMHWRNFERLTAEFFNRQGYEIEL